MVRCRWWLVWPVLLGNGLLSGSALAAPETGGVVAEKAGDHVRFAGDLSEGFDEGTISALWFDGREFLIAAGDRFARIVSHGGVDVVEETELLAPLDGAGTRAIRGGLAVFVNDRQALRYHQGSWENVHVPLLEGDALVAVAVDSRGRAYCVGGRRAVYVWQRDQWRAYPFPAEMRPLAATVSPGGHLFIVGRGGLVARYWEGEFTRMIIPGLSAESRQMPWHAAWYGATTGTLWVRVGKDRLIEIDVDGGAGIEHRIPEYDRDASSVSSGTTVIDGHHDVEGDRVALAMGRAIYVRDGGRFLYLGNADAEVQDLVFVGSEDRVHVATRAGISGFSTRVEERRSDDGGLSEDEEARLAANRRWRKRVAHLRGRQPTFWLPTVRLNPGVSFAPGYRPRQAFFFEGAAGVMIAPIDRGRRGPTFWLWPEVAYRVDAHRSRGGQTFDVGLGVGWGTHVLTGYYRSALALGGLGGRGASVGFSHSLSAQILWGIVGVDVGQELFGGESAFRVGVSFNVVPWVWLAIL